MKSLLLILLLFPLSIFAQQKLAYLNADDVFIKMPELKDVESKIAAKKETIQKNVTSMETEYNNMIKRFSATPTDSITPAITADREAQIVGFQERYRNYVQNSQQELEKEQQALLAPLQQKLAKAIKDVGDENSYTFIFNSATLLHTGSDAKDASGQVKAKLGITN